MGAKEFPPLSSAKGVVLCRESHHTSIQSPSPWKLCLDPYHFHCPVLPFPSALGDQYKISSDMVLVLCSAVWETVVLLALQGISTCPSDIRENLVDPDLVAVLGR